MPKEKQKRLLLNLPTYLDKKALLLAKDLGYPYKADAIRFSIAFTDASIRAKKLRKAEDIY